MDLVERNAEFQESRRWAEREIRAAANVVSLYQFGRCDCWHCLDVHTKLLRLGVIRGA